MNYKFDNFIEFYKKEISISSIIFNGKKFRYILIPITFLLISLSVFLEFEFNYNYYIFVIALLGCGFISFFLIINPYAKFQIKNVLKINIKSGFFKHWMTNEFKNYQRQKIIDYLLKSKISKLEQYEILIETIDNRLKSKSPAFLIKIGVLFTMLIPIWLQINQWIINKITDVNFILIFGLILSILIFFLVFIKSNHGNL